MANDPTEERGPIAWMAGNSVTANLLMLLLIVGGFLTAFRVKQEVLPEFNLDIVEVSVPYPGATPSEVEEGVLLAVEEEIGSLDGVRRVTSWAFEGTGTVQAELLLGADPNKLLQDVKGAVDRITSFPADAERPTVRVVSNRRGAISLVLYGDLDEGVLRQLAERVRDELLQDPDVTLVELDGVRRPEISIEVPQAALRAYGLTLKSIADEVARASVELPGGAVKTDAGDVLLRVAERRRAGLEFADVPLLNTPDGGTVRLGDLASIVDGFEQNAQDIFYNGHRAVALRVFRVGEQGPVEVAGTVHRHAAALQKALPPGVGVATWGDFSEVYRDRIDMLLRNACIGLVVVMVVLGLFMEVRLAFWVAMGIPASFLGAILLMPLLGVSINMISLFAFIMALGMVVDDAIVVGENIDETRSPTLPLVTASTRGARQVAVPVTFAVLTNVAAFLPLFFVPGVSGKLFRTVPAIVVPIFLISLCESLFIFPAHVAHKPGFWGSALGRLSFVQRLVNSLMTAFIKRVYTPALRMALGARYAVVGAGVAIVLAIAAYAGSGWMDFGFMPRVESDLCVVNAALPYGSPVAESEKVREILVAAARRALARCGGERISRGILAQIGRPGSVGGEMLGEGMQLTGNHLINVQVLLVNHDQRSATAAEFTRCWREETGEVPGLDSVRFDYNLVPTAGRPIDVQLSHRDPDALEAAADELAGRLRTFAGLKDVDDGFSLGKAQLALRTTPEAQSLGIDAQYLGRQVRSAFYGAEAIRQQRGRDEIKVMVRLPEAERRSEYNIEELVVRTPAGGEMPLREAAQVVRGRSYREIKRAGGRRVIDVTADVEPGAASAQKVLGELRQSFLPDLLALYPGLTYSFAGEQNDLRDTVRGLSFGFAAALMLIFALLAIPLRSYVQPLIVMAAVPFGIVGAIVGHLIMGLELSLVSALGFVALAGVVVNDSLVLVHSTNERRDEGDTVVDALLRASARRFRPILLTSLTTFGGVAPMIFEKSMQGRFLVPMAVSLGFGVLFATLVTLVLVPALYLIAEDVYRVLGAGEGSRGILRLRVFARRKPRSRPRQSPLRAKSKAPGPKPDV